MLYFEGDGYGTCKQALSDTSRNKTFKFWCQSEVLISEKKLLVQVVAEVIELIESRIQCKEQNNHAFCTGSNQQNKKKL